jgi:hypothetical protein
MGIGLESRRIYGCAAAVVSVCGCLLYVQGCAELVHAVSYALVGGELGVNVVYRALHVSSESLTAFAIHPG